MLLTILIALGIVCADQVAKYFIVLNMQPGQDIPVIEGILHLHYAQNSGAAFSFLQGLSVQWLFIGVGSVASVAIICYLAFKWRTVGRFGLVALGFVLGGALGNLVDRLRLPSHNVIDYVYVKAVNFAIFNVADSCITIGAILLCIYLLFFHEKHLKSMQAEKPGEPEPEKPDEPEAQG